MSNLAESYNREQRRAFAAKHPFGWEPWVRGRAKPLTDAQIAEIARRSNRPVEEVQRVVNTGYLTDIIWMNNVYQVAVRVERTKDTQGARLAGEPEYMHHVSIKRCDRKQVGTERFQHFQRIKSDLFGDEAEGVELYPAESRLVDGAHQYHMWVLPVGQRFRFGFDQGRLVTPPISEPDGAYPGA